MRTCVTVFTSLALVAGCSSALTPPPELLCTTDGGCGPLFVSTGGGGGGGVVVVGGGGGGHNIDAGVTDGGVDGGVVTVNGTVSTLSSFPGSAATRPATGWTVEAVNQTDLSALTDSTGAFQLIDVPTFSVSGAAGSYYGLLARPVGADLGTYQVFSAGGAANLTAITLDALQAAVVGTTAVDQSESQVVVYTTDSLGAGGHPVANVIVQPVTDSATTVYDDVGGILTASGGATGSLGIAVVLNLSPGTGANASRTLSLQATHSGITQTFNVQVFGGAVTWVSILVAG